MQLTTTNGINIYVNPSYIFKIEPISNGSKLSFEVEKFVLQDLQDIEISQTPEQLTELLKECLTVQLLNSNTIYLNRKYIFKIVASEGYTEIYLSVKDVTQKYRVYQVSNTVENLISQIPTSSSGGNGNYLPLTGGTMSGGIHFEGRTAGLSFHSQEYGNTWISGNALGGFRYIAPIDDFDVHFDFLEGIYHHYQNKALSYSGDYSVNFTARSLVDKAYVDNAISSSGGGAGGNYLPLAGGAMQGSINMQENFIYNIGGISYYNSYLSLEENIFDLQGGIMSYAQTPTPNDYNNLIHKGYVDDKINIYKGSFEIIYAQNQDEPENYIIPDSILSEEEKNSFQATFLKDNRTFYGTILLNGDASNGYTVTIEGLQEGQYSYMIVIHYLNN